MLNTIEEPVSEVSLVDKWVQKEIERMEKLFGEKPRATTNEKVQVSSKDDTGELDILPF